MSTSHDVKALFDRFGGDPTSYREIRMENEAHEARGRWPLLGMIDPRKVELSAAGAPGEVSSLATRDHSQAALRRSAPLFTRSPRSDVPPIVRKEKPVAPGSGAFRFSPEPLDSAAATALQPDQPAAAPGRQVPIGFATPASGEPLMVAAAPYPSSNATTAFSPFGAAAPLKKLFRGMPVVAPSGAQAPATASHERLDHLFDRLRGGTVRTPTLPVTRGATDADETNVAAGAGTQPDASHRPWFLKAASKP